MTPRTAHTSREYEAELQTIRERLLRMAGRVEHMIGESTRAFATLDADLAKRSVLLDRAVNRDEMEIDHACLEVLALRQPLASDLRFIAQTLKMVTDLERIGDLAVNVCERVQQLAALPSVGEFPAILRMADIVRTMVHDAIESFVRDERGLALTVIARDDEVDELYHTTFREIMERMRAEPPLIEQGLHVMSVAKVLERMADHSTNLAEEVVYVLVGDDIRHPGKLHG